MDTSNSPSTSDLLYIITHEAKLDLATLPVQDLEHLYTFLLDLCRPQFQYLLTTTLREIFTSSENDHVYSPTVRDSAFNKIVFSVREDLLGVFPCDLSPQNILNCRGMILCERYDYSKTSHPNDEPIYNRLIVLVNKGPGIFLFWEEIGYKHYLTEEEIETSDHRWASENRINGIRVKEISFDEMIAMIVKDRVFTRVNLIKGILLRVNAFGKRKKELADSADCLRHGVEAVCRHLDIGYWLDED